MTYTYAILKVSPSAFHEIRLALENAEYQHAFHDDVIDMHGIALQALEQALPDEVSFNAGFDAAVRAILGEKGMRNIHVDHPQYLADRSAAYRKARG